MLTRKEHGPVTDTVNSRSVSTHKAGLWVSAWWICVELGKLGCLVNVSGLHLSIHSSAPLEAGKCSETGTEMMKGC